MLHAAFEHVGHGLEAAVGMVGRALGLAGAQVGRPHLVEEEEGVEVVERPRGEGTVHHEALALHGADGVDDLRHGTNAVFGHDPTIHRRAVRR